MNAYKSHSRCEQSCPIHPVEQEHLLGAMHLPFTQDGEQIAAVKKRQCNHTIIRTQGIGIMSDQHTLMVYISSADVDIVELYERGREQVRKEKEAEERKQSEGKPKEKKKKKKDAEGVDTQTSVGSDMGIKSLFVCELCTRVSCMQECDRK